MVGNNPRGSWEIPVTSHFSELDRSEKARCRFPISAGLAPAGSQLASYIERIALTGSPLGSPQWRAATGQLLRTFRTSCHNNC